MYHKEGTMSVLLTELKGKNVIRFGAVVLFLVTTEGQEALCLPIGRHTCCIPQAASQTTRKMRRNSEMLVFGVVRHPGHNVGYFTL